MIDIMVNAVFLDYKTLFNANAEDITFASFHALKEVVKKCDDIRIICLNTDDELVKRFDYDFWLDQLSQFLNLKKSLFFDIIRMKSWNEASGKISSWMSVNEVRSFAIVIDGSNANASDISKSYANNTVFCDNFSEAVADNVSWILSNYKNSISKNDNLWFVADSHFSHANIVRYCNRPWNSGKDSAGNIIVTDDDVKRMDEEMIRRWNSVVGKNDVVWHLGDFAFGGKANIERIFPRLNGRINLVMGNHDHYKLKYYYDVGFHRVYDKKVIIHDFVILSHAPLMFLNDNTPFFNVFGHIHDSPVYQTWSKTGCCVCVERHNYIPVSWCKIKEMYDKMNTNE